ncbi:MAG TPA: hypothetical protein VIL40_04130 [Thermaerobacter sp.]
MSIGGVDGPHLLQSATAAQRLQRLGAEAVRGEEQAQRFAALLGEARRQQRVGDLTAASPGGRTGRRSGNGPGRDGDGTGVPSPASGKDRRDERRGGSPGDPQGRRGLPQRRSPAPPGGGRAAVAGEAAPAAPGPTPDPRRGSGGSKPVPEGIALKGQHLDRTV